MILGGPVSRGGFFFSSAYSMISSLHFLLVSSSFPIFQSRETVTLGGAASRGAGPVLASVDEVLLFSLCRERIFGVQRKATLSHMIQHLHDSL